MPFPRPTLPALIAEGEAAMLAELPGGSVLLRRSPLRALNIAGAGARHEQYGLIDRIARNLLPDTAETEWLERAANLRGVQRKPGTAATLPAQASGTDGYTLPAGSVVTRGDGIAYATLADATIAGGVAAVTVQALPSASSADPYALGSVGNTGAGTRLALRTAVAGIDGTLTVTGAPTTPGVDAESDDSLRARLLLVLRNPPQGGVATDYVNWALAVPGVTAAWCYPLQYGLGTVGLSFICGGRTNIIPTSGDITAVQAYIDTQRPVTASVTVWAPTASPLAPTITNLLPNTAANQAAMQAAFAAALLRDAQPALTGFADGKVYLNRILAALSGAGTVASFDFSLTADVTPSNGHIVTAGTLVFA